MEDGPYVNEVKDKYEAALGKFLVEFNHIEYLSRRWIHRTLTEKGLSSLSKKLTSEPFSHRINTLQMLAADDGRIHRLQFDQIRTAGERRNLFAHGHFDQDPNGTSFDLVGNKSMENVDIAELLALAASTEKLAVQMMIDYWFDESPIIPEEAIPINSQ